MSFDSFASLGLHPDLLRTLTQRGHLRPTAIQAAALPSALAGRDLIGAAVTGSGKTLAYVLPILQHLLHTAPETPRPVRALVLVPARDLALQVSDTFAAYAQALAVRVKVVTVFGGVSVNPQLMALRGGADVVVATPGRLLDLVARRRAHGPEQAHSGLRLDRLDTLVLDEADRLLEDGFADELGRVLGLLPRRRRQWLFSATFGPQVLALARDLLEDPVQIGVVPAAAASADGQLQQRPARVGQSPAPLPLVGTVQHIRTSAQDGASKLPDLSEGEKPGSNRPQTTLPATLVQRAIQVDTARRTALLRHLLQTEGWTRVLVFVATRYATEHVAGKLNAASVRAAALHGELSQGARTGALADFRSGAVRVLVATDMASRGLHLEGLPAVVNFDLARSPATHIHRVGRTARQGTAGVAVSFIAADDPAQEAHFRLIEKRQGQRVVREQVPGFEPTQGDAPKTAIETGAAAAAEASTFLATAGHPPGSSSEASDEPEAPRKGLDPHGGLKGRRKSRKDKLREALAAQSGPSR
jgi:ATP-dependent RNA helicase RhlE